MPRLITEWSTDDPGLADTLRSIAALGEHTEERMEVEAALHMFQARLCWSTAERLREARVDRAARQARAEKRRQTPAGQ